ncbi:MAG: hypothetical protein NC411_01335 [Bacteroides sp.]|nr:hypothetical protein [Bacteroides sp.]
MAETKTKKCEVCGARKPLADFSKSYRNRCKSCVATEMRMHLASEAEEVNRIKPKLKEGAHRMGSRVEVFKKARIKLTGEVVEVEPYESVKCSIPAFKTIDGRIIPQTVLQFTPEIDWEQRRYELAKAALQGLLANQMWMQFRIPYSGNADECIRHLIPMIPKDAIAIADAAILELKIL